MKVFVEEVLDIVRNYDNGAGAMEAEILNAAYLRRLWADDVKQALRTLGDQGRIINHGTGRYSLPPYMEEGVQAYV